MDDRYFFFTTREEVRVRLEVVLVRVEDGADLVGDKDRDLIPVVVLELVDVPFFLIEGLLVVLPLLN